MSDPPKWSLSHQSNPGSPGYIDTDEFVRRELARRAEYEARPDVIARRAQEAESAKRRELEKNASRKRPKLIQSTDYPWLADDGWIDRQGVRPFKGK